MEFKIIPSTQFDTQLRKGAAVSATRILSNRFAIENKNIQSSVGNYIVSIFESTEIVKSLRGNGTVDLPAHFGLSNNDANGLVNGMIDIIKNSIVLASRLTADGGVLSVRAVTTDWQKYTQLPGAKYISKSSQIEIPVVEWMLVDPSIDIGAAAYDIVFHGSFGGKFNTEISQGSRSGRAIMVSLSSLGGSGGYVLPDIISNQAGKNFIEFAIGQPQIAEGIFQIVLQRIL